MQNIGDVFLEIANSEECLNMIYKNYIALPRKNKYIDYTKLKNIIKSNERMSIIKKYRNNSGDALIILTRLIAKDALADEDPMTYLKMPKISDLINLKKFCVAIANFSDDINDKLDLILENHKNKVYLFSGIDKFKLEEDEENLAQLIKIQNELNEFKAKASQLESENNYLKEENRKLLESDKNYKKQLKGLEKELKVKSDEKESSDRALNKANETLLKKDSEIESLKLEIDKLNNSLEKAVVFNEVALSEDISKQICIIHTMNLSFADKIYYDIEFQNYKDIEENIKEYLETLKSKGISKVGIQSNKIRSLTLRNIMKMGEDEGLIVKRIFFNSERELIEKIINF